MSVKKITTKKAKPTYEYRKNLGSGAVWCGKVNKNFNPDNEIKYYSARVERECPYLYEARDYDEWDGKDTMNDRREFGNTEWYLPNAWEDNYRECDAVMPMKKGDIITYNEEIGIYFCKKCAKANKKEIIDRLMYMVERIKKGDKKYEIINGVVATAEEKKCPCCKKSYEWRIDTQFQEMRYFDYHKIHQKNNEMLSVEIQERILVIKKLEKKYIIPFTENEKVSCDKCFKKLYETYFYTEENGEKKRIMNIWEWVGEEEARASRKAETRLRKEFLQRKEAVRIIEKAYWNTHTELGKRIFMNRLKADGIDDAFDE